MSLPSYAKFYNKGVEVKIMFTNCGWFCNVKSIKNGIVNSFIYANIKNDSFDWDTVEAYGEKFTKEEIFPEQ